MKEFDVTLIEIHDKIEYDRSNLIDILREIDNIYFNEDLPEYTKLLYLNYIYLSELSYLIKEYYVFNNIIIHEFK
jgi:hypothetical protein